MDGTAPTPPPARETLSTTATTGAAHRPLLRWLKLLFWTVAALNFVLALTGILEAQLAILVAVLLEAGLFLLGLGLLLHGVRTARSSESSQAAFLAVLSAILPDRLARFVLLELRTFATLVRWILRWRHLAEERFTYRRRSWVGVLLVFVLLTTPAELVLLHVLLPWAWLRWALLVVVLYGLLWLWAFWASLSVYPHTLDRDALVARWLYLHEVRIPLREIAAIQLHAEAVPNVRDGLTVRAGTAWLAVGGRTDVRIDLHHPITGQRFFAATEPFHAILLAVDEPERLVASVARRLELGRASKRDWPD